MLFTGAIGGPKWTDPNNRPEQGLLKLRKSLNLFANIRPNYRSKALVLYLTFKRKIALKAQI
ncbi:isocitrate/isopropylmalate family dehydrogenase [Staphylococcus aureus]